MVYYVSALYPMIEGSNFDVDYYVNNHMPLAERTWAKSGLLSWTVIQYKPGADGKQPKYWVQAIMIFESEGSWNASAASLDTAAVVGDTSNFTTCKAELITGLVVGASE